MSTQNKSRRPQTSGVNFDQHFVRHASTQNKSRPLQFAQHASTPNRLCRLQYEVNQLCDVVFFIYKYLLYFILMAPLIQLLYRLHLMKIFLLKKIGWDVPELGHQTAPLLRPIVQQLLELQLDRPRPCTQKHSEHHKCPVSVFRWQGSRENRGRESL